MATFPIADYRDRTLPTAIVVSVSAHLIFAGFLVFSGAAYRPPPAEIVFSAELVPATELQAPKKTSQIVSPPKASSEPVDRPKRLFESEQDNSSPKEQIKRGEDGASLSSQKNNPSKQSAKPAEPRKEVKQPSPKLETHTNNKLNLKLNKDAVAELASDEKAEKPSAEEKLQQAIQSSNQKSSVNISRLGTRDYLPDIPDGEVTLLNTKANKYAVFVRRVASQVFANLRGSGWMSLQASDIRRIGKDSVFVAILSPQGQLLSVTLQSSSESDRFDQVLQESIKRGAKDPNPPAGAEAEDGNIHFIFQAKSWVQVVPSSRNGAPTERRWLVLGTGLE